MLPRTILLVLLTLAVPAADSSAQEVVPEAVVRIQQWDAGALIGRVQQLSADSLWLRNVPSGAVWPVPFSSIALLEVRQPASRGRNAWRWAKRGFAIGAVAGALVCLIDQHNCTAETPTGNLGEAMLGATLFFGAAGAAYGAAGGALFPGASLGAGRAARPSEINSRTVNFGSCPTIYSDSAGGVPISAVRTACCWPSRIRCSTAPGTRPPSSRCSASGSASSSDLSRPPPPRSAQRCWPGRGCAGRARQHARPPRPLLARRRYRRPRRRAPASR